MSLNLEKGGTLNLSKSVTESKVIFGLGWTGKNNKSLDLDSYIVSLDKNNIVIDFIYLNNKSTKGIKHNGDDLVGGGSGKVPNETIEVKLSGLNPSVSKLIAGLFIYSGANNLGEVDYAFTQLQDSNGNKVVSYNIKESFEFSKSVEVAQIEKVNDEWVFTALGNKSTDNFEKVKNKYKIGKTFSQTDISNSSTTEPKGFFARLFS